MTRASVAASHAKEHAASEETERAALAHDVALVPELMAELRAVRDEARRVGRLLERLPAPQREAFLLAEEGGLSLEEIAAATATGRETVKSRLRYAVGKLRHSLQDLL